MIEAGCLKTPEVRDVIGLHVEPELRADSVQFIAGAMNAASCRILRDGKWRFVPRSPPVVGA